MDITVNGKKVVLRDRYPMREFQHVRSMIANIPLDAPWEQRAKMLSHFVVSWEFEGKPSDPNAWGDLDEWAELIPLENLILSEIVQRGLSQAKNLPNPST